MARAGSKSKPELTFAKKAAIYLLVFTLWSAHTFLFFLIINIVNGSFPIKDYMHLPFIHGLDPWLSDFVLSLIIALAISIIFIGWVGIEKIRDDLKDYFQDATVTRFLKNLGKYFLKFLAYGLITTTIATLYACVIYIINLNTSAFSPDATATLFLQTVLAGFLLGLFVGSLHMLLDYAMINHKDNAHTPPVEQDRFSVIMGMGLNIILTASIFTAGGYLLGLTSQYIFDQQIFMMPHFGALTPIESLLIASLLIGVIWGVCKVIYNGSTSAQRLWEKTTEHLAHKIASLAIHTFIVGSVSFLFASGYVMLYHYAGDHALNSITDIISSHMFWQVGLTISLFSLMSIMVFKRIQAMGEIQDGATKARPLICPAEDHPIAAYLGLAPQNDSRPRSRSN